MKIVGTGSCLPQRVVSNDDLAAIMDTSDEWISSRTGIRNRHIATIETTTSLACDAVKSALQDAGIDGSEIDSATPAQAVRICRAHQERLRVLSCHTPTVPCRFSISDIDALLFFHFFLHQIFLIRASQLLNQKCQIPKQ